MNQRNIRFIREDYIVAYQTYSVRFCMNLSTHWFFQCNSSAYTTIRLGVLPPFAFLGVCWRQRLGTPVFMVSPSELFSVKTHICVKKASRYGPGRGIKSREQFRKHLRVVVNIVVRTRNGSGHGKRYSLAVGDIYGIGRLPFLASLYRYFKSQSDFIILKVGNFHP